MNLYHYLKVKNSFSFSLKKYDLFKEALKKQDLSTNSKYEENDFSHNRILNRTLNDTDFVIK